jgi:hypothetical protein
MSNRRPKTNEVCSRSRIGFVKDTISKDHLSAEREKRAMGILKECKTLEDTVSVTHTHNDTKMMLLDQSEHCECPEKQRALMINRSTHHKSQESFSDRSTGYSILEGARTRSPCRRTCSTIHNPMFHV